MPSSKLVLPKKELSQLYKALQFDNTAFCMHIHMLSMMRRNKTTDYSKNAWRRTKYCFRDSKIFLYMIMQRVMGIYLFSKYLDYLYFYLISRLNWSRKMRLWRFLHYSYICWSCSHAHTPSLRSKQPKYRNFLMDKSHSDIFTIKLKKFKHLEQNQSISTESSETKINK